MHVENVRSRPVVAICAAVIVMMAVLLYALADPAGSEYFPKCPFHVLTGLDCPGCGSQRALHALLNLRIGEAFRYNALMVAAVPFIALLLFSRLARHRLPGLYSRLSGAPVAWTVLAVTIAWWILRNVLGI